jgi:hypothetical protein
LSDFMKNLLDMAKNALPLVEAAVGTSWIGAAITAGQAVIKLIDDVKDAGHQTPAELDATRDQLEAAVNQHVDQTISDLRGGN